MDLDLRGKKAIINGASAGMGKSTAFALAREGVDLILSARGEERLFAAANEIQSTTGVSVTPIVADHSAAEGRDRILTACPEPDILISTCSPPKNTPDFRDINRTDWEEYLAEGLLSPIEFLQSVIDGMIERRFGRIINITTGAAKYPAEIRILSGGPRAALNNYMVAVAKKVAKYNVTVNSLLPGMHHTATAHDQFTQLAIENNTSYETEVAKYVEKYQIPAERFGSSDDFGEICAFLCSRQANYIVGQSLVVDGGVTNSIF